MSVPGAQSLPLTPDTANLIGAHLSVLGSPGGELVSLLFGGTGREVRRLHGELGRELLNNAYQRPDYWPRLVKAVPLPTASEFFHELISSLGREESAEMALFKMFLEEGMEWYEEDLDKLLRLGAVDLLDLFPVLDSVRVADFLHYQVQNNSQEWDEAAFQQELLSKGVEVQHTRCYRAKQYVKRTSSFLRTLASVIQQNDMERPSLRRETPGLTKALERLRSELRKRAEETGHQTYEMLSLCAASVAGTHRLLKSFLSSNFLWDEEIGSGISD